MEEKRLLVGAEVLRHASLARRAQVGEDFASLAKRHSEDLNTKANGGEVTFSKQQVVPEFAAAAFSMKPGQVSEIVETQYGYHIIKVEERLPARSISLDEARPQIVAHLKQEELNKRLNDYLDGLKEKAEIEILTDVKRF